MKTMATIRPGDLVNLRHNGEAFPARLEARLGHGEEARLRFTGEPNTDGAYEFEIYRYNGRWAAGTGATRITVARD